MKFNNNRDFFANIFFVSIIFLIKPSAFVLSFFFALHVCRPYHLCQFWISWCHPSCLQTFFLFWKNKYDVLISQLSHTVVITCNLWNNPDLSPLCCFFVTFCSRVKKTSCSFLKGVNIAIPHMFPFYCIFAAHVRFLKNPPVNFHVCSDSIFAEMLAKTSFSHLCR